MKKNGLKNRPLIKTTFSYQPPQADLVIQRTMNRRDRSLRFQDQAVNQGRITSIRPSQWVFIFIFGVWMFFLGVVFGRQTTPVNLDINSIETELARLKAIELGKEKEDIKTGIAELNEKSLDFYEDLKKGSTRVIAAIPGNHNTLEIKKALSTKKNIEAINPENIEEDLPEAPSTKIKSSEPEPKPESEPSKQPVSEQNSEHEMDIGIQAASFIFLKDAENLVSELKEKGYTSTYYAEEDVSGVGRRYRVKVGFFRTKDDAQSVLKDLKDKEYLKDAYIFKRKP
ncbi:Sporulation related domain-containing protein [Desulfonema limicola]|uniref:Sporulation related domain-containing protein n=1 Tax=Desulfonema limicola TaxID=45656 RepID=A0A975BEL2_9BACT|nr:SPOR domain-containing protein [Desulfonema limicola]QTA83724.1 Sporulation related domain-containing protein [Desulfonema limicola]